ncbi:hypothetical protein QJS10_CPA01g02955 [Acorus calamus]|uniref:4-coumarate--CoA ligase n=1 Tax=Acorus calamus TaxID=4465 RepID=A0AAV9FJ43_ACOCL|nr:hypothetical protein QJS10_CPA01g02955 [Acorus calamus]
MGISGMASILFDKIHEPQISTISTTLSPPQPQSPPTEHIFRSKLPDIPITNHLPLHSYIFENLSDHADRPCLIVGSTDQVLTYSDVHLTIRQTASGLSRRLGLRRGDVVMVLLQNCPEFVYTFMASSMIGAITTTANPFYTPSELSKQIARSNAKVVVTHAQYAHKVSAEGVPVVTIDDRIDGCLHFSELLEFGLFDPTSMVGGFNPDDAVALPFSSGTTGLPKGVVLTHKSLSTSLSQQVDGENPHVYLTKEDVVICVLPLFHIFALNSVLLCSLRSGAAVLMMQKFEISTLLELIQRYRVSVATVVPPLVLALVKCPMVDEYDLSSIRIVLSGAAPLGKELEETLHGRVPQAIFGQGYGMTEAGPVLSMCLGFAKQPFPTKSGSCGTVVRNAELKVIDPETGYSLPRNKPGEICFRGAQIMKGYLNDPEATQSTIDVEGWLHTGDIGYVDDDDEVFIVDRVKELIKYKGFQVAPAEIEAILHTHPSIIDAAVIPQKDEVAGEVPVAFIVQSNGSELTEGSVKEYVAKQVVFYKKVHKVYFVHAIPKSPSGKILRKELRTKLPSS